MLPAATYWMETSSDEAPCNRKMGYVAHNFGVRLGIGAVGKVKNVRPGIVRLKAPEPCRQAPLSLEGSTAHQVPAFSQTLDCGFSPVVAETGIVANVCV